MPRIARVAGDFGAITILRSRAGASHIYMQGEGLQSHADRDGVSLSYYIHALYDLILQSGARDILMIGCGGGTLATMLVNAGRRVTAIDVVPATFDLARRYFALSPAVRCHLADGLLFLRRRRRSYDAIVVDAFVSDKVPKHLRSETFFRLARKRLGRSGLVLLNVLLVDDRDLAADAIADAMTRAGLRARLLDTPGEVDRNCIVLGGLSGGRLHPPKLHVAPKLRRKVMSDELEALQFRVRERRRRFAPK